MSKASKLPSGERGRVRVKFCGITRSEDAIAASDLGADAIGIVFHEPSPRAVSVEEAKAIAKVLPAFVTLVGLFVNADVGKVEATLRAVPLDILQFHGNEEPAYCEGFGRRYIKAITVGGALDVAQQARHYPSASAFLLDTYDENVPGGTGKAFDWSLIPRSMAKPVILAGGLTQANVGEAIVRVRPHAVDVSGGVEASKGIKDAAKMAAFIEEVRRVEFSERKV